MNTKTKTVIVVILLWIIDMVIPIPILGVILLYVVLQIPPWVTDVVREIYKQWFKKYILILKIFQSSSHSESGFGTNIAENENNFVQVWGVMKRESRRGGKDNWELTIEKLDI